MNILAVIALLCTGATHTFRSTHAYSVERTGKDVQECQRKYISCVMKTNSESFSFATMLGDHTLALTHCVNFVDQK